MTEYASAIFEGHVVHKRLTPKRHGFAYRVFALSLDVDEIDRLSSSLRLFSSGATTTSTGFSIPQAPAAVTTATISCST